MKTALRLSKPLGQAIRAQAPRPAAAPIITLLSRCQIAGPSTLSRSYATLLPPSDTPPSQAEEQIQIPIVEESSESSIPTRDRLTFNGLEIPPNVQFEGFDEGEGIAPEPDRGGDVLHFQDPNGEIRMPLSSLASSMPTQPAESGETIILDPTVFAQPLRKDILHRCVVWFLSTLRQGSQSTKNRSTLRASGRKLRQQKGTGRARVGDASSGILRGGAPIFALSPRDHALKIPRKIRTMGLHIALSSKLYSGLLRIVPSLSEPQWQGTNAARRALCDLTTWTKVPGEDVEEAEITKRFAKSAKDLSILFVKSEAGEEFERVVRNLPGVEVLDLEEVQVWHILKYRWLVMDQAAVAALSGDIAGSVLGEEQGWVESHSESDAELELEEPVLFDAAETPSNASPVTQQ